MTPLWTSRPELIAQYGITEELCQTSNEVAVEMASLVEEGTKYPGGTILLTSKKVTRLMALPEGLELFTKTITVASTLPTAKIKNERGALL
jgi:hypothetical protein